jgi:hypothetical protein
MLHRPAKTNFLQGGSPARLIPIIRGWGADPKNKLQVIDRKKNFYKNNLTN